MEQSLNNQSVIQELNLQAEGGELQTEKVLGLWWSTKEDVFTFKLNRHRVSNEIVNHTKIPTKREVTSIIMSHFDPFGFLSHYMMFAKTILQDIWRSGISWDEQIPANLRVRWNTWISNLKNIENIRIPRWYSSCLLNYINIQLHIFVDASEEAFAAVGYLRVESKDHIDVTFVASKCRVAPLKMLSIPRLELQAALLGARLSSTILKQHSLQFDRIVFWSDSRTVISWIKSDHRKYKQFVAHRVSEILDTSDMNQWNWIPTKENVADEATKWKNIPECYADSRWFRGPEFLRKSFEEWPSQEKIEPITNCTEDLRVHFHHIKNHPEAFLFKSIQCERISKWTILVRSVAWLLRSINIFKNTKSIAPGTFRKNLFIEEIQKAENVLIRKVQFESYPEEVLCLLSNQPVPKKSNLYQLSPYLDEDKILRIKGRIDASPNIEFNMKRPVILDRHHYVTKLIIHGYHQNNYHQLSEIVVNEIRRKFWIANLRTAVKQIVSECQFCKNKKVLPQQPEMSPLPMERVTAFQPAFNATGIDYFGPISVTIRRSTEKRYGVIFTCLASRAVHLEIAYSLTTDSFIMALQRFICRRGTPEHIYCDNGTNFVGAKRELQKTYNIDYSCLAEKSLIYGIKWHFNTPASPHHGGAWERLIQSIKKVMNEILKTKSPRPEVLHTVMVQVEAVMNNRPLTYVPIEPNTEAAITPNSLLLGRSSGLPFLKTTTKNDEICRKYWRQAESIANQFWRRWVSEYLPTLTRRTKWFSNVNPVQIDDIVVIVDPNTKRNNWPLGKIVSVYPGRDGNVRSVQVKTATGVYDRPVSKIAKLDVKPDDDVTSG